MKNPDARPSFKELRETFVAKVSPIGVSLLFLLRFLLSPSHYDIAENWRRNRHTFGFYKHKLVNELKKEKVNEDRKKKTNLHKGEVIKRKERIPATFLQIC